MFPEIIELTPNIYSDIRGENFETFNVQSHAFLNKTFITDTFSKSKKNVIRGLHGDTKTTKLVQCLQGEIFLVVVDFRKESSTFLKYCSFKLSEQNRKQILIPPNFLNGHACISTNCLFSYKLDQLYNPDQISIYYKDPILNIHWPIENPILSERDKQAMTIDKYLNNSYNKL